MSDVVKLNLGPAPLFGDAGIRFAFVANFIQQLTVAALADENSFLASLQVMPIADAVRDSMGFGMEGTRLREPGQKASGFEDFKVEYIDVDEPFIQSDGSRTVFVSKGVVKNIVKNSLASSFGDVGRYESFIKELLGVNAGAGSATDIRPYLNYRGDYLDARIFPLGEVLENAGRDSDRNILKRFSHYSDLIVGQFLFIGAHEIGHERLRHREHATTTDCITFLNHEREADKFAAEALADFNFGMGDGGTDGRRITDFEPFFLAYKDVGFGSADLSTSCAYDDAETRRENVTLAYNEAISDITSKTYGGPDLSYEPKGVWCYDGKRRWLQEFR